MNKIEPIDLIPLINKLWKLMELGKFKEIELILENIDYSIESEYLVTYIRTTYPARRYLNNWNINRDKVKETLEIRKLDSDKIMRGLY